MSILDRTRERDVRLTVIDHALGRRIIVAEFKRVPSKRVAAQLIQGVFKTDLLITQRWELPEVFVKSQGRWVPTPLQDLLRLAR